MGILHLPRASKAYHPGGLNMNHCKIFNGLTLKGNFTFAIVLAYFLFAGDPDITDAIRHWIEGRI